MRPAMVPDLPWPWTLCVAAEIREDGRPPRTSIACSTLVAVLLLGFLVDHLPSRAGEVALQGNRVLLRPEFVAAFVGQTTTTPRVSDVSAVEQALRRAIPDANFVLIYSAVGLEEIRLYAEGISALTPLAPGENDEAPLDVGRLQSDALTSADPDERATALEELAGRDDAAGRAMALAMLQTERDEGVLERVLHIVLERAPPVDRIADFAAADRPLGPRTRALEFLTAHSTHGPQIADLFRFLATRDKHEEIRTIAVGVLRALEDQ